MEKDFGMMLKEVLGDKAKNFLDETAWDIIENHLGFDKEEVLEGEIYFMDNAFWLEVKTNDDIRNCWMCEVSKIFRI